ncbi:L-histidine N(alpha)-methyltransferase [Croceivirga thetidis]|uniref:L-histidine N(Alpha)-methyltransferase n=1 Tax=Croceivirga thetidis TaxID=2721623 RepID=A0ABX1GNC9_9FLAO|nr:L-histidine N(alpha)-methyltransferase [Croceivirga thetidis]NKI30546.1 L-histidine N(alpha)-methyltransferase [Croceivirga thetidis]
MQENTTQIANSVFAEEVRKGLTDFPKHLSSKYFYDATGDELFQQIMAMPEYYLTNCEFDILERNKAALANLFGEEVDDFSLFELGAGDGKKTKILLKYLSEKGVEFDYRPIDISQNALDQLEASINLELPKVKINTLQGTYFDTLKTIGTAHNKRKIILFLGSNIGNLLHPQAIDFLKQLRAAMNEGDLLFMGMDQKKNPQTILDAYNDKAGITAAFNKNVLTRINNELGGDFNLDNFIHWEVYDPETGTAKSYLVAQHECKVRLEALDLNVRFKPWETIHTEISQKYDDEVVSWLANEAGLSLVTSFADEKNYFKDYIFKK